MGKKLTKEQIRKTLRGKAISNKDRKLFSKPLKKYFKAENGIEGTMGGLTDIGFDYNGAWGGPSMAMGGGIPGSVGFTYARTQGAAPSNGPYAKKTKPSAQNGMEMKYYQEGLDFKPKTISQDGSKTKKARQPKRVVVFAERPIGEDLDNKAFITEAENVKSFYKRTSPNTKVEVLPIYETGDLKTKQKIQNTLAGLSPEDDVMVFGHHGSKYAGIPTEQWATLLQDSNYGNCYLGSCQSEDVATGAWKNVRNLVYRPATPWKGFNPKGSDLISAMFSRGSTPPPSESEALYLPMPQRDQYESQAAFQRDLAEYERKVNEFNKRNRRTLDIEKPILGVDYKVKPNPPKYQSNAEWITNPLFSGSRQTGLPITLTAPTKKKKYGGWLEKYQDGGIIEDPMGQWAYPGEITRIPSNEITMQGVDYPVLGISDTGDTQMMQPGQDYTFDGNSVTEIPMMQKGGAVKDPGYSEPDYVTGTSRRTLNKMIGMGNYLVPANVLNQAADIAELKGYGYGEDNEGPLDAVRHAAASASVASRIPVPKMISEYSPALDRAIRIAGANALGIGHELVNFNPEGLLMDIKNNYRGSLVGSIPGLTDKQRNKMIVNQLTKKQLTVDNPKKKKENGGWLNKYE